MKRRSIAVVGAGTAGLTLAWILRDIHDVAVFEAAPTVGGHACTLDVAAPPGRLPVDMAVEYFTERLAPNLTCLLDRFGIETYVAPLSFAVGTADGRTLWSNRTEGGERADALRGEFDRFHRGMIELVRRGTPGDRAASIEQYLDAHGYSQAFRNEALLPLLATYSGCDAPSLEYSLAYCAVSFNMNLLSFFSPGYWRKARGGMRTYLDRLAQDLGDRIRLEAPVRRVERRRSGVSLATDRGRHSFEDVVFATHADQALAMLAEPSEDERRLLGSFEYVPVEAVLHRDTVVLGGASGPEYCRFLLSPEHGSPRADGTLTRIVTNLPGTGPSDPPVMVSFDPKVPLVAQRVVARRRWKLPKLRPSDMVRRAGLRRIQGRGGVWYCGTDTSIGGHEGALTSGLVLASRFGAPHPFASDRLARLQFNAVRDLMGVSGPGQRLHDRADGLALALATRLGIVDRVTHRFARDYLM